MNFFADNVKNDLLNLAKILEEENRRERRGVHEQEEAPEYQKDLDAETVMYDCDATDCKFWNEGFKGNCTLKSIEIDPKHGCAQYQPREQVQAADESDDELFNMDEE